jgi:hypothetical protein
LQDQRRRDGERHAAFDRGKLITAERAKAGLFTAPPTKIRDLRRVASHTRRATAECGYDAQQAALKACPDPVKPRKSGRFAAFSQQRNRRGFSWIRHGLLHHQIGEIDIVDAAKAFFLTQYPVDRPGKLLLQRVLALRR